MSDGATARSPRRTVHTGDALAFLDATRFDDVHAVFTSLPDLSETPALGDAGWRAWFVDVAARICGAVAPSAVAVFYQTDVKRDGRWVDKGHLVAAGAERSGAACVFHKIVCRAPSGTPTFGRPGFARLMAFSRELRVAPGDATADVLPALGEMSWARAMGTAACEETMRFLVRSTACRVVVDPFCGVGTALAVANAYGLDAIGVERSAKRAERARRLTFAVGRGLAEPSHGAAIGGSA